MIAINILIITLISTIYILMCTTGFIFMITTRLLLSFNKSWQLRFVVAMKKFWLNTTAILFSYYFVHPLNICYNKEILNKKKCLIVSNHLTYFDWIYVLVVLAKLDMYDDLIIILKESLSKLPVFGYGMKIFGFIFLKRDWNSDKNVLKKRLHKLKKCDTYFMLLFPEGTLIDPNTHIVSKRFCKKNPVYIDGKLFNPENVMLPRKTGFNMIFENLKDHIDGVVDLTLLVNPYQQYPSFEFTMYDVFIKRSKKLDFMFLLDYIDKTEIKNDQWLYELFSRKNDMIETYKNMNTKGDDFDFKRIAETIVGTNINRYKFKRAYFCFRWKRVKVMLTVLGYVLGFNLYL